MAAFSEGDGAPKGGKSWFAVESSEKSPKNQEKQQNIANISMIG